MRPGMRRSWPFVPGADEAAQHAAARSGADVIIQELDADAKYAKQLGYRMKSLVTPDHAAAINRVFIPRAVEISRAKKLVTAFEKARKEGKGRAKVDGKLVEVPIYAAAKRLIESTANIDERASSARRPPLKRRNRR